jgi:HTH-type transcriptional regulator, glycine betaine synthesis regulator
LVLPSSLPPSPHDASPNPDALRAVEDRFIAQWGQMAGAWGISRTMAEVHALLYITGEDLNTDDVMDRLQISRGNASMSLRALLDWGIVQRTTRRGDRKEYFRGEQDVWALFRAIVRERMAREVDPLMTNLHEIRDLAARAVQTRGVTSPQHQAAARLHQQRLDAMLEFFSTLETLSERFVSPSGKGLRLAASVLRKLPVLRPAKTKHTGAPRGQSTTRTHDTPGGGDDA